MRFGIDVGGTTVKIGVVDNYEIKDTFVIKTTKDTLFKDICESIKEYIKKHNINNVELLGFGLPGNVQNNYIVNLPNIGIKDVNLVDEVRKYITEYPIASTNDANAAALGEALFGTKVKASYFITLGTGVGGGYVYDNKVIDGIHCACGEVGHMYIDHIHEYQCSCGLKGCFETVASATGVVRLAKEYYNKFNTKLSLDGLTCKDVFDAAKENDELGLYILELVSKYLARGLANIACTTDVDVFYIGGGVAACGDILINKVKEYYKQYAFYACKNTDIQLAKLGNSAGMLGAAYII